MADDENAVGRRRPGERVQSRRRQRQQYGFVADCGWTGTTRVAGATRCEAAPPCSPRTAPKHARPARRRARRSLSPASGSGLDNRTDGLIARDERISHARKRGHSTREQQALGARADAAPERLDYDVAGRRRVELEGGSAPGAPAASRTTAREFSMPGLPRDLLPECHFILSIWSVK